MIVKPTMVKFNTAAVVLFPVLKGKAMLFQKIVEFRLIAFQISDGCGLFNGIAAFGADRIGADHTVLDEHLNDISTLWTFHFQNCDGISGFLTVDHFCTPLQSDVL